MLNFFLFFCLTSLSIFTARVAKRAKVMFSQACVTHSVQLCKVFGGGGGRRGQQHQRSTTSLPSLGPGHNTSLPPGPGHNTWKPPPDQVTTPPSPLARYQVITPPSHPWDQVITPPSPHGTRSQHLPPPPGLCTGGRYASHWNAFLFSLIFPFSTYGFTIKIQKISRLIPLGISFLI